MVHFHGWPTEPKTLDSRAANYTSTYKPTFTKYAMGKLKVAYDEPPNAKDLVPGHAYDPAAWGAFSTNVMERASYFIDVIQVPMRWWMATFTCAFVDVSTDMGLAPPGQECWAMDWWCAFWTTRQGECVYSPNQLMHFVIQWTWWRDVLSRCAD